MYKVILADDEPIVRKALLNLTDWEKLGCEVVLVAQNGREVIDKIEVLKPDIIISDIKMPEITGIDIAGYIYEKGLPVKTILLTAFADFSFAQAAVKYNVVEYVTKTGAMDGIESAVEKAKGIIEKERTYISQENKSVITDYFLKGILDGSIFDKNEIREHTGYIELPGGSFLTMVFRFTLPEHIEQERRTKIFRSLKNFFSMEFEGKSMQMIPISSELFCIIKEETDLNFRSAINAKCIDVIDMMDNFMNLSVFLGISDLHSDIEDLKVSYEQALEALQADFFCSKNKINFYVPAKESAERYSTQTDEKLEEVVYQIKMGNAEEAACILEQFFVLIRKQELTGNTVKQLGFLLEHRCTKILAGYETTLKDVMDSTSNATELIYQCYHMEEFENIISDMVKRASEYTAHASKRTNGILCECQNLIDLHYKENVSVTEIADRLGVSASYLSRIYKENTGNTIIGTINKKKIEEAKEYLEGTDMKIYEIADLLGFDNITYFSHFFKKYTGVSPKDFKGKG